MKVDLVITSVLFRICLNRKKCQENLAFLGVWGGALELPKTDLTHAIAGRGGSGEGPTTDLTHAIAGREGSGELPTTDLTHAIAGREG